jgi:hypothetical protein
MHITVLNEASHFGAGVGMLAGRIVFPVVFESAA